MDSTIRELPGRPICSLGYLSAAYCAIFCFLLCLSMVGSVCGHQEMNLVCYASAGGYNVVTFIVCMECLLKLVCKCCNVLLVWVLLTWYCRCLKRAELGVRIVG